MDRRFHDETDTGGGDMNEPKVPEMKTAKQHNVGVTGDLDIKADAMGREICAEEAALAQDSADARRILAMREPPEHPMQRMPYAHLAGLYSELLSAVARKFPGETRHQTALRYIKEAEGTSRNGPPQCAKA